MQLVIWPYCPFCHRVMIVVNEKDDSLETVNIDLQDKPDWFLQQCPTGKVPVLLKDNQCLFESLAISEYLDDTISPQLHPQDSWLRAMNRAWMEQCGDYFGKLFAMLKASDEQGFDRAQEQLIERLHWLESTVAGPYFNGEDFAMVDAMAAPFLIALHAAEAFVDCGVLKRLPRLAEWAQTLKARPSIQRSLPDDLVPYWQNKFEQQLGYVQQFRR